MADSHIWASSLLDVSSYGVKEWAQLTAAIIGIIVAVVGAWRTWRYSKSQIAARLRVYLEDEETKIKAVRDRVIRHLRHGTALNGKSEHDLLRKVADALAHSDPKQREKTLDGHASSLVNDADVGEKFVSNTNLQLATLYLVRGKSAQEQSETTNAKTAWEEALHRFSRDAEAERYLGELALAAGDIQTARKHFSHAYSHAPDDKLLRAETWEQVAVHYRRQGLPKVELKALMQCAPNFSLSEGYARAATAYARAGELAAQLNFIRQAPDLLRAAFENYRLINDRQGMKTTRDELERLGEDVSSLPHFEHAPSRRPPWPWIRFALELSILATAAVLFYFTLR